MYTVEVFSDGSRSSEVVKKYILADTGTVPSVYEHGTHYIVNHKTTLGTLERIQKYHDSIVIPLRILSRIFTHFRMTDMHPTIERLEDGHKPPIAYVHTLLWP